MRVLLLSLLSLAASTGWEKACYIRRPKDCPVTAVLDSSVQGLRFDGHGAVSGRGTSRYLYDYAEPMRSEILDLLFAPNYAASIQVLKVEIGGDAQTGFGVEPSHRRISNETSCERVRTTWLIREARQRNPDLVVLASAWAFPAWVGVENASQTSFYNDDAIDYILSWIRCANETGAGHIDYIGSRPRRVTMDLLGRSEAHESPPLTWTVALQNALVAAELPTRLVLPDAEYDPEMAEMLQSEPQLAAALSGGAFGLHYPCFIPMPSLEEHGLAMWSTEDGGMPADWPGAACAGRTVNTNLVRMNVTSTLLRSLVWAVHPAIPGHQNGLISAAEPWSGVYSIQDPLWMLAHTTRFTQVGWWVLPLQSGATGHLKRGGTFVTYLSPDRNSFTLVVEKLQARCQSCAGATTGSEEVVFTLSDGLMESLKLDAGNESNETDQEEVPVIDTSEILTDDSSNESDSESENVSNASNETMKAEVPLVGGLAFFVTNKSHKLFQLPPLVVDPTGSFSFVVQPDTIYTITSMNLTWTNLTWTERMDAANQSSQVSTSSFPVPYHDDFDMYVPEETPGYFADYGGSFEVSEDPSYSPNLVLKQVLLEKAGANRWTSASDPITLIGHRLANVAATVDVYIPDAPIAFQEPIRLGIQAAWNGHCLSTRALARETALVFQESCEVKTQQNFFLEPTGRQVAGSSASMAKSCVTAHLCSDSPYADRRVCVRPCSNGNVELSNQTWVWYGDGSLRLRELPELCLTQGVKDNKSPLELAPCQEVLPKQRFLDTRGEMTLFAGVCIRLQPRQQPDFDAGELLNGLPGRRGYCLRLGIDAMKNGVWRLESGGQSARLLARGRLFSSLGTWHRLRLAANGTVIRAKIDDQDEVVAIDSDHTTGAAALFSGWHETFYDNFALQPAASLEPLY